MTVNGSRPLKIAIVGGGITGLSAAFELRRQAREQGIPCQVSLFERDGRLGGKVASERFRGCLLEAGPDSFMAAKPWMRELCQELEIADRLVNLNPGGRPYVLWNDRLHAVPGPMGVADKAALERLVRSGLISREGVQRALDEGSVPPLPNSADESLADFARRRFGDEVGERVFAPLLAVIHGGDAEELSMQAAFPHFLALEGKPGGLTAAMSSRGVGGLPPLQSVRDGLGSVIARLQEALSGVRLAVARGVEGLRAVEGGYELTFADGEKERFNRVLLTTPAGETARLLETIAPRAAAELAAIPYGSTLSVYLAYRTADVEDSLRRITADGGPMSSYVAADRSTRRWVSAAVVVSQRWVHAAPDGWVLFRCHVRGNAGDRVHPDDEVIAAVGRELAGVLGFSAPPVWGRVFRWRNALPRYRVGHVERVAAIEEALADLPGLAVAGAAYRGIGLSDCVRQGREAATRLLSLRDGVVGVSAPLAPATRVQTGVPLTSDVEGE